MYSNERSWKELRHEAMNFRGCAGLQYYQRPENWIMGNSMERTVFMLEMKNIFQIVEKINPKFKQSSLQCGNI